MHWQMTVPSSTLSAANVVPRRMDSWVIVSPNLLNRQLARRVTASEYLQPDDRISESAVDYVESESGAPT